MDDRILIDAGPTAPHLPAGVTLVDVEHVLLTHGHPDHLNPAFLLAHAWTEPTRPLHVWGPAAAIDLCRDWVGPESVVQFHPVVPGDQPALPSLDGTVHVQVLPARHGSGNGDVLADEAVLYRLTMPDGAALLYATDTGPFEPGEIGLPTDQLDVVLLDATFGDTLDHGTGHLDLGTLPAVVEGLRRWGAVGSRTRVIATHLSHHNPPTSELRARLAAMGVEVLDDFSVVDTSAGPGHRTLVLGGARSGKSSYAEVLLADRPDVTYIATGGTREDDAEWQARIAVHRVRRPAHWHTVETADLAGALMGATGAVLIDCLALWLTAQLDQRDAWQRLEQGAWQDVLDDLHPVIDDLAATVAHCAAEVVLVSNEVGMGVVPTSAGGRIFQDLLGRTNRLIADVCEDVILLVAGRPLRLRPTEQGSQPW